MSYAEIDTSVDHGAPYELYEFSIPNSGLEWRYSNTLLPVNWGGNTYTPEAITRGSITREAGTLGGNITVEVADENPFALELYAGLSSRPVAVTIRQVHRTDPAAEARPIFVGLVAGVTFSGARATITCGPRFALASKRKVPWITYQAGCNWEWGGKGCGVNKANFKLDASLASTNQTGRVLTVSGASGYTSGHFSGGYVQRVADGDTRFIEKHAGTAITLASPFRNLTGTAETFWLFPGCRKNEEDCLSRFQNLQHYLGWARLPSINPYNRSAYYLPGALTGVTDPGETFSIPGYTGYELAVPDQSASATSYSTTRGGGSSGTSTVYHAFSMTLRIDSDGYLRVVTSAMTVTSPVGWLRPRPSPDSGLPALFQVRVDSGSWVNLSDSPTYTRTDEVAVPWGTSEIPTASIPFFIEVREISTGLIRVSGTLTAIIQPIGPAPDTNDSGGQ